MIGVWGVDNMLIYRCADAPDRATHSVPCSKGRKCIASTHTCTRCTYSIMAGKMRLSAAVVTTGGEPN